MIDATVLLSAEQQNRLGLADPLDAGPQVVRIGRAQIRQGLIDGVGVDIDEAGAGGRLSVDGGGSTQQVRRTGCTEDSYYAYIIQDMYA